MFKPNIIAAHVVVERYRGGAAVPDHVAIISSEQHGDFAMARYVGGKVVIERLASICTARKKIPLQCGKSRRVTKNLRLEPERLG